MFGKSDDANISVIVPHPLMLIQFLGFLTEVIDLDQDISDFLASSNWPDVMVHLIPEGLLFDLFDVNDVFPTGLTLPGIEEIARLRSGVNEDRIGRFTFNRQMDALNPFVFDIDGFKERLFTQSGTITNTTRSDCDELFRAYGH